MLPLTKLVRPCVQARTIWTRSSVIQPHKPSYHRNYAATFTGGESPKSNDEIHKIDGKGKLAVIFGGFGFKPRQMQKHLELYEQYGFETLPIFSNIYELTCPSKGHIRGPELANLLQAKNKPIAIHTISGSVWTVFYMLEHMDPEWRAKYIRAIVFDSCPPRSDIYAFGGWLCYAFKLPPKKWQSIVSHLFHPYRWYMGINSKWEEENAARMKNVIPKESHLLFMHGRNDPVLDTSYVTDYANYLRSRTEASCVEVLFDKARHSMGIVDHPELYKSVHVNNLLAHINEWKA